MYRYCCLLFLDLFWSSDAGVNAEQPVPELLRSSNWYVAWPAMAWKTGVIKISANPSGMFYMFTRCMSKWETTLLNYGPYWIRGNSTQAMWEGGSEWISKSTAGELTTACKYIGSPLNSVQTHRNSIKNNSEPWSSTVLKTGASFSKAVKKYYKYRNSWWDSRRYADINNPSTKSEVWMSLIKAQHRCHVWLPALNKSIMRFMQNHRINKHRYSLWSGRLDSRRQDIVGGSCSLKERTNWI